MDPLYLGDPDHLGFPIWIRATHWFNVLFLFLLVRSGVAILAAHPKLYWNIDSRPGSEWVRFSRKRMPSDRMWCSTDEEVSASPWLALPGGHGLGLGRYWHFFSALGWLVCGLTYIVLLFLSPQWRRLVPLSWDVFPLALKDLGMYLSLQTPSRGAPYSDTPFNPLQQLTYFGLIFVLTPFQILTGLAQSPSILGRFPWYDRLFGNRQTARSLHFLGMVAFLAFLLGHLTMIVWHGYAAEMNRMVLGHETRHGQPWWMGAVIGTAIVAAILGVLALANLVSSKQRRATHWALSTVVDFVRRNTLHNLVSVQNYDESEISPHHRINGYPPIAAYPQAQGGDHTYEQLLANEFADYRLEITGLVETPLSLSLADLRAMPRQEQTTLHHCIQGWTSIGRWGRRADARGARPLQAEARGEVPGVSLIRNARVFRQAVLRVRGDGHRPASANAPGRHLNGEPLPLQHGAPLRVRFETKLGFKMVKFLRRVEVVDDYRKIGGGMGGVREDEQQFDMGAEI